jgi:hypothetical protein
MMMITMVLIVVVVVMMMMMVVVKDDETEDETEDDGDGGDDSGRLMVMMVMTVATQGISNQLETGFWLGPLSACRFFYSSGHVSMHAYMQPCIASSQLRMHGRHATPGADEWMAMHACMVCRSFYVMHAPLTEWSCMYVCASVCM